MSATMSRTCSYLRTQFLRHPEKYYRFSPLISSGRQKVFARTVRTSAQYLSNGGKGKGNSMGSKSGRNNCPRCGEPFKNIPPALASARFVVCESCHHFYQVITDYDFNSSSSEAEKFTDLPSPKQICDYLNRYVIGQQHTKKVLSVAVYNHYKRLSNNLTLPRTVADSHKGEKGLQTETVFHGTKQITFLNGKTDIINFHVDGVVQDTASEQMEELEEDLSPSQLMQNNHKFMLDKSNILLMGPTGSGKTLLARTLAKCLNVPFVICDCTALTQAGYVGEDIESIIAKLLCEANYNVDKAQRGIVFLDEVDKIGSVPGFHQLRDVGGEGVQQGLLKILEGSVVHVPEKNSRKIRGETVPVDTTNILFIASGAFNGIDKIVSKRLKDKVMGFNAAASLSGQNSDTTNTKTEQEEKDELFSKVETGDLIKFGMIPEFIGRLPITVSLHSLDESDLTKILTEPRNALIPQYQLLFKMDQVELVFGSDAITAIAQRTLDNKSGARGLRAILENLLLDAMFDIPGSNIERVYIDKDIVMGKKKPEYHYSETPTTNNETLTQASEEEVIDKVESSL
ncbi:ATP-dependent Clp protease ATP-binding subunit clpX-like, mitochondrial isoform X2 [Dysidea avara]|uniref:ATP-dependent Clp protease ATP-binding subunit clpX-like, mitochondrial isoform X2 n=1 Tax=Dysidea avara TaxID=196820 RepID=UPI00332A0CD1